jgi:hypothetical protein
MLRLLLPALVLIAMLPASAQTAADPIADAIQAALKAHQAHQPADTAKALQLASNLLAEKLGGGISAAMPREIGDWERGKVETQSLASSGGGTVTNCSYRKGEKGTATERKVSVSITADSPLLTKLSTLLKSPMLGELLGQKATKVGDYDGMFIAKEGVLQLSVAERFLIVVQGKKLTEEEMKALALGLKLDALKSVK